VAIRDNEKFAFEAKTQSISEATIKPEDLDGVKKYPEHAIIAVLSYPDLDCNWVLAKAEEIRAGKWSISFLKQHSIPQLEEELDNIFPEVLKEYSHEASLGTTILYAKFHEVWKIEKRK